MKYFVVIFDYLYGFVLLYDYYYCIIDAMSLLDRDNRGSLQVPFLYCPNNNMDNMSE